MSVGPGRKSVGALRRSSKNSAANVHHQQQEALLAVYMGHHCTSVDKDESAPGEDRIDSSTPPSPSQSRVVTRAQSRLTKSLPHHGFAAAAALTERRLKRKYDTVMADSADTAVTSVATNAAEPVSNWSTLSALEDAIRQRRVKATNDGPNGDWPEPRLPEPMVTMEWLQSAPPRAIEVTHPISLDDYNKARREIMTRESVLAFDYDCRKNATEEEETANQILQKLRQKDKAFFEQATGHRGHQNQRHKRHPGDHFLTNVDLLEETEVFRVARRMPKGAHLHIHFNSCLKPSFLLDLAKSQKKMDIGSNRPLLTLDDLDECEIQFSIRGELDHEAVTEKQDIPKRKKPKLSKEKREREREKQREEERKKLRAAGRSKEPPNHLFLANLFTESEFIGRKDPKESDMWWMNYQEFRSQFPAKFPGKDLDGWLEGKIVYNADEAHGVHQTAEGAWDKFNKRTRMMKGLFNYETAYREYTKACLQDFVNDNIQYAEIRPNFMRSNQVWSKDARQLYNNTKIMEIITEECDDFLKRRQGCGQPFFQGIKVIYCAPRSFPPALVEEALDECLDLKLSDKVGHMIAGFDLVGQETAGKPLEFHAEKLLQFRAECSTEGVDIPFLFHCGETIEMGTETDRNVVDALVLGSKRIGHGFALARHPYVMEKMKEQDICLEVCPISNEILGLTPRINGHAMYNLLANNVHCTINSDNGTLFRSSLSHDFYQVFVGREDFSLFGWKQLIQWSLKHACLDDDERQTVYREWEQLWSGFIKWINNEYEHLK